MEPSIKLIQPKKLIGKRKQMSFAENKTFELWKSFMPRQNEISNILGTDLFSVSVYDILPDFNNFNPQTTFQKWAASEVADLNSIPPDMETFILPGGLYAMFNYKGLSTDTKIFEYIFTNWLPGSEYELDNRPHFEILGAKYKNNHPDSEEEIWIPIKLK